MTFEPCNTSKQGIPDRLKVGTLVIYFVCVEGVRSEDTMPASTTVPPVGKGHMTMGHLFTEVT